MRITINENGSRKYVAGIKAFNDRMQKLVDEFRAAKKAVESTETAIAVAGGWAELTGLKKSRDKQRADLWAAAQALIDARKNPQLDEVRAAIAEEIAESAAAYNAKKTEIEAALESFGIRGVNLDAGASEVLNDLNCRCEAISRLESGLEIFLDKAKKGDGKVSEGMFGVHPIREVNEAFDVIDALRKG